jgi:glutamate dehydrogenase/leucine dehydrogenase
VLITAAAERQVNAQNAARIRASLVLEAVFNAVTPTAAAILHSRGFTVVSSLLGSAPATLAGFVEWQHAILFSTLEQSQVESTIRRQLSATFHRAQSAAVQQKSALPDACYMLALEQIAAALRLSG